MREDAEHAGLNYKVASNQDRLSRAKLNAGDRQKAINGASNKGHAP